MVSMRACRPPPPTYCAPGPIPYSPGNGRGEKGMGRQEKGRWSIRPQRTLSLLEGSVAGLGERRREGGQEKSSVD